MEEACDRMSKVPKMYIFLIIKKLNKYNTDITECV